MTKSWSNDLHPQYAMLGNSQARSPIIGVLLSYKLFQDFVYNSCLSTLDQIPVQLLSVKKLSQRSASFQQPPLVGDAVFSPAKLQGAGSSRSVSKARHASMQMRRMTPNYVLMQVTCNSVKNYQPRYDSIEKLFRNSENMSDRVVLDSFLPAMTSFAICFPT